MSEPQTAALDASASGAWKLFVFLWAQFAFIHQALIYYDWFQFSDPLRLVLSAAVFLAAVPVMLRPGCVRWLTLLLVLWLVELATLMPRLPNHMFLTLCANATILLGIAWRAITPKTTPAPEESATKGRMPCETRVTSAALYRDLAPLLRLYLLILYFYAVLHKLNWDYLDPLASCGVQLYQDITQTFAFLPTGDWTRWPTLLGALSMEAIIPLLLIFRRTRTLGVVIGLGFHLTLALHYNLYIQSFTTMLLAFYCLFFPPAFADQLASWWERRGLLAVWRRIRREVVAGLIALGVLILVTYLGYATWQEMLHKEGLIRILHDVARPTLRWSWFALIGLELLVFVRVIAPMWSARLQTPAVAALRPILVPATLVLPLVFFNGLSPYLGLKTQTSFAMFSNLRTEGQVNNHLFMPKLPVASYQATMVKVLDASEPQLRGIAERQEQLPLFELRTKIADAVESGREGTGPDFFVVIERDGLTERITPRDTPDHIALTAPPWYERRFLHFRTVPYDGQPCTCRH